MFCFTILGLSAVLIVRTRGPIMDNTYHTQLKSSGLETLKFGERKSLSF
jgi:hypothetical protein